MTYYPVIRQGLQCHIPRHLLTDEELRELPERMLQAAFALKRHAEELRDDVVEAQALRIGEKRQAEREAKETEARAKAEREAEREAKANEPLFH